ncbi:MAG: outer membrane lipoprotein chaperone LolA [Acidobacteriota bacterium]
MKTIFAVAVSLALAAPAFPAANVEQSIAAMQGTQASFVQKFVPRGFHKEQIEKGVVVFGASPKMRWTYLGPDQKLQKLFVFDGKTSWFFVPEDRQVTVNTLDEAQKRDLPFLLLADSDTLTRSYNVKESRKGDILTSQLASRVPTATFREITVTTSLKDRRVRTLSYTDRQGNRTTFEFGAFGKAAPGAMDFSFSPPPGVEVVKN